MSQKLFMAAIFAAFLAALPVAANTGDGPVVLDRREVACLAAAAWVEARGRPQREVEMVMHVVLNRARHPDFPGSVCEVVFQRGQFEMAPGIRARVDRARRTASAHAVSTRSAADRGLLDRLEGIAEGVLAGAVADRTGGATHFYTPRLRAKRGLRADPPWASKMRLTAKAGEFVFRKMR